MLATLERLKHEEVDGVHFEEMCQALDEAKTLRMDEVPLVRTCNLRVNAVRVKIEVQRALVQGEQHNDPAVLRKGTCLIA